MSHFFHKKHTPMKATESCAKRRDKTEGRCVPTWIGICHAWAPASIELPEPKMPLKKITLTPGSRGRGDCSGGPTMRTLTLLAAASLFSLLGLAGSGCAAAPSDDEGELILENGGDVLDADPAAAAKEDHAAWPFVPLFDDLSPIGDRETRLLFTTAASYRAVFGHDAPGVNFAREWVFLYSAGVKPTGYSASVAAVFPMASGLSLRITTRLDSPGHGCAVAEGLSRPAAMVKFHIPPRRPPYLALYRSDVTHACAGPAR